MVEMPSAPRTEQRWTSYPIINGARRPMTRNFSTNGVQTCDYLGREGCSEGASYRVGCRRVASRNLGVKLSGAALDGDVDACPECMEGYGRAVFVRETWMAGRRLPAWRRPRRDEPTPLNRAAFSLLEESETNRLREQPSKRWKFFYFLKKLIGINPVTQVEVNDV